MEADAVGGRAFHRGPSLSSRSAKVSEDRDSSGLEQIIVEDSRCPAQGVTKTGIA